MMRTLRAAAAALALAVTGALGAIPAQAQGLDPAAIAKFADQYFQQHIAAGDAPGVVVGIAVGGKVVHVGGYGMADVAAKRAMDPEATAVRAGQASQLVTALIALRVGERAMDDDVQGRLGDVRLNQRDQVTLRQLLTHNAGIGDRVLGQTGTAVPLAQFLASRPIPIIARPAQVISPSSLGMALAGLVLEHVAEPPAAFADLAQNSVLRPLGLAHTAFGGAAPATLAKAYVWKGGAFTVIDDAPPLAVPATGLVTTARDMASLMAALTGTGAPSAGGEPLWPRAALAQLTSRQAFVAREMPGESLALAERTIGARTAWVQEGGNPGSSTAVALVPDLGLGVFVAANGGQYDGLVPDSRTARMVRGFAAALVQAVAPPAPAKALETAPYQPDDAIDYGGIYLPAAIEQDTAAKVLGLALQERVRILGDIDLDLSGTHIRKVALDLFQAPDGTDVKFIRPAQENATHLALPQSAFVITSGWAAHWVQASVSIVAFVLLALGGAVSLVGAVIWPRGRIPNAIGTIAGLGGVVLLAVVVTTLMAANLDQIMVSGLSGLPFAPALWLPLVILAPFGVVLALFGRGIHTVNRLALAAVTLGWAALYPVLATWNLI